MEVRDPSKKHFFISIFKSVFRVGASYGLFCWGKQTGEPVMMLIGILFGIAEILGILEEL